MKTEDKIVKGFENFTEFVFWLQLAASPILTSIVIGGLVSASIDGILGYVLWGIIVLIGIIAGVALAEFARTNKGGTAHFASRVMASEDLDNFNAEKPAKKSSDASSARDSGSSPE